MPTTKQAATISVAEASRRIGVSSWTVYRRICEGRFPPVVHIGPTVRVSVAGLQDYLPLRRCPMIQPLTLERIVIGNGGFTSYAFTVRLPLSGPDYDQLTEAGWNLCLPDDEDPDDIVAFDTRDLDLAATIAPLEQWLAGEVERGYFVWGDES